MEPIKIPCVAKSIKHTRLVDLARIGACLGVRFGKTLVGSVCLRGEGSRRDSMPVPLPLLPFMGFTVKADGFLTGMVRRNLLCHVLLVKTHMMLLKAEKTTAGCLDG